MTTKKRGLGRGLESLLADTNTETAKSISPLAETETPSLQNITHQQSLITLYKENHLDILQEAEYLKQLLDDLETLLQHNK
ncbi:MAG: hypothetical protein D4R63_00345 [Methylococcaceae bacterium]|nr:MAG: hypothetical protein D4R63_00345 [Methylococcaceae bacterium]